MKTAPSARFAGTSPKYDKSEFGKFCKSFVVVFGGGLVAKVHVAWELQSTGGAPKGCDKELSALMASILDKAFKGEL